MNPAPGYKKYPNHRISTKSAAVRVKVTVKGEVIADTTQAIELHEPQKAVTPGQAAVIYDGDIVVGGGWICRAAALQLA